MSILLSERQTDDLHKAILDYLHSAGFTKSFEQFKEDAKLTDFQPDLGQKSNGLLKKHCTDNSNMAALPPGFSRRNNPDWLPTAGSSKHTLTGHRDAVNAVAFHPVYSVLVSASDDSTMKVWDWETGEMERTLKGHTKRITDCEYDSKARTLSHTLTFLTVSCAYDLFIKLWNVENDYQNFATLRGHEHSVSSSKFLPGDDRIISFNHCIKVIRPHSDWIRCAIPNTAHVVELDSGTTKSELRGHDNVVEAAVFVPVSCIPAIRELLGQKPTAAPAGAPDNANLVGHDDWVRALVFHPNGKYLLSAADDHTIRIWELKTGRCIRKIEAHERFMISSDTNGKAGGSSGPLLMNVIASASSDQTLKIWMP
ncbi:dynein regulator [Lactarius hengduanensis]|nr:dynein regulator [Lactarius hengduanensis]